MILFDTGVSNCDQGLQIQGGTDATGQCSRVDRIHRTDPLALILLAARVLQSSVHLASLSAAAVSVRFSLFVVQLGIAVYWTIQLLQALI